MPTSATDTFTTTELVPAFRPDLAIALDVKLKASTTFPQGCVLGEVTATPGLFAPYASGASDGTENPKAILAYACTTDASSKITLMGQHSATRQDAKAYFDAVFFTADLPQSSTGAIDSTALTNAPTWKLWQGTTAAGILKIG